MRAMFELAENLEFASIRPISKYLPVIRKYLLEISKYMARTHTHTKKILR